MLLNQYGITTYKVFKTWAGDSYKWEYHCAVMVIDANDKKWVLDPWVSLPLKLLTINQWLKQKDDPVPRSFSIANSTVLGENANYQEIIGEEQLHFPHLTHFLNAFFLKRLRTIYSLMTPSKLERPIAIQSFFKKNQFTLFAPKEPHSEASSSSRLLNVL